MTIKEIEKLLNISRANIRFYEKQGLLSPERQDNEYRNYSENDIKKLKQIIIFRKCNISIDNIKKIFNSEKKLEEITQEQLSEIEKNLKELAGAQKICKLISKDKNKISNFDENKYLKIISEEEKKGNIFHNFAEDFFCSEENFLNEVCNKYPNANKYKRNLRFLVYLLSALFMFCIWILLDFIFFKSIDFASAIYYSIFFAILNFFISKKYYIILIR